MFEKITIVGNILNKQVTNILESYNLTQNQWLIIKHLFENENESVVASDLVNLINKDKRTISLSLKQLEDEYMVIKIDNELDSRKKLLILSDNALSIAQEITDSILELEDLINNLYSYNEQEDMNSLLERITDIYA